MDDINETLDSPFLDNVAKVNGGVSVLVAE